VNGSVSSEVRVPTIAKHTVAVVLSIAALSLGSGCGGVAYSVRINSVEAKVEKAKELGAEQSAPYQFYSAKERVDKAREEAGRADYGDSLDLLDEAEKYADEAINQASAVRKGAGR
jgi:hypothetical protein